MTSGSVIAGKNSRHRSNIGRLSDSREGTSLLLLFAECPLAETGCAKAFPLDHAKAIPYRTLVAHVNRIRFEQSKNARPRATDGKRPSSLSVPGA